MDMLEFEKPPCYKDDQICDDCFMAFRLFHTIIDMKESGVSFDDAMIEFTDFVKSYAVVHGAESGSRVLEKFRELMIARHTLGKAKDLFRVCLN